MRAGGPEKWSLYDTQPAFVLGFHGCDKSVGESILRGKELHLTHEKNDYDWLGHGRYFWEANPQRAMEFAIEGKLKKKVTKGQIKTPFVLGAIINLGNCLNLINSAALQQVKSTHNLLQMGALINDKTLPTNSPDQLRRKLDCSVFEALHMYREIQGYEAYSSVRGVFWEGDPLYPGTAMQEKNHIQLCVRDTSCIMGYFRPIELA